MIHSGLFSTLLLFCGLLAYGSTAGLVGQPSGYTDCNPFLGMKCLKACPQKHAPLCGSDGITYLNDCLFSIAKCFAEGNSLSLTKEYPGICCQKACSKIYVPLCGSDGKTYGNKCLFDNANCLLKATGCSLISIAHKGECSKPCDKGCTKEYAPLCGSDGKTYGNQCMFDNANCLLEAAGKPLITIKQKGECQKPCDGPCIEIYDPLCGSDGNTYSNNCYFNKANCLLKEAGNPLITITQKGECPCNEPCIEIYQPLCGSDGKTYSNQCYFNKANCLLEAAGNSPITVSQNGECPKQECNAICTLEYNPVCGSDGVTYGNQCSFDSAKCFQDGLGNELIKANDGPCVIIVADGCDAIVCLAVYDPVCGSDGKTYSNKCVLGRADCKSREKGGFPIMEAKKGEC